MTTMMRILFPISLILVLASCGNSLTPSDVVREFYDLASRGEVQKAREHVSHEVIAGYEGWGKSVTEEIKKQGSNGGIEIKTESIKGEIATVEIGVDGKEETVNLIKEDGAWKIGFKSR